MVSQVKRAGIVFALSVFLLSVVTRGALAHGTYVASFGAMSIFTWIAVTICRLANGGFSATHTHTIVASGRVVTVEVWKNP